MISVINLIMISDYKLSVPIDHTPLKKDYSFVALAWLIWLFNLDRQKEVRSNYPDGISSSYYNYF